MLFNIRGDPEIIINQCSKLSGAILGLITIVCGYIYSNIERISTSEGVLLVIAVILLCIGLWGSILVIFSKAEEKRLIDDRKYHVELSLKRREIALKEQERKDNLAFREQELALKEQERKDNLALKEQERKDNFILREQAQNAEREIRLRELEIKAQQIALEERKLAIQEAKLKAQSFSSKPSTACS